MPILGSYHDKKVHVWDMPREWAIFTEQQQQKNKLALGFFSDPHAGRMVAIFGGASDEKWREKWWTMIRLPFGISFFKVSCGKSKPEMPNHFPESGLRDGNRLRRKKTPGKEYDIGNYNFLFFRVNSKVFPVKSWSFLGCWKPLIWWNSRSQTLLSCT